MIKSYQECLADDTQASCIEPVEPDLVTPIFTKSGEAVPYDSDNLYKILAYTVPARTEPLGQDGKANGEISGKLSLSELTNSNQDHSAQFHGYYSEPSHIKASVQQRADYWRGVLGLSLRRTYEKQGVSGLSGLSQ